MYQGTDDRAMTHTGIEQYRSIAGFRLIFRLVKSFNCLFLYKIQLFFTRKFKFNS